MKKFLFTLLVGCIPTLVATNGAYAQNSVKPDVTHLEKNIIEIEKPTRLINSNVVKSALINPKALKNFNKNYKNVTGEGWEKIKDGFAAEFIQDNITYTIYYNFKGRWTGTLKRYVESKMPHNIRDIVKRAYYDFSISSIDEIETLDSDKTPTYIVHLENQNNVKLIRITDMQMDVKEEFKKS